MKTDAIEYCIAFTNDEADTKEDFDTAYKAAAELQELQNKISTLQLENLKGQSVLRDMEQLRRNFAEYLATQYNVDPYWVAELCDEQLDKSGALLGYVRDAARALDNEPSPNERDTGEGFGPTGNRPVK